MTPSGTTNGGFPLLSKWIVGCLARIWGFVVCSDRLGFFFFIDIFRKETDIDT